MLPSVGASSDTPSELLSGKSEWRLAVQRCTPKVPEGFSSGCRGRSLGLGGSVPPYGGIPFGDFPTGLGHDLGCPERLFARALAIRGLAHSRP